MFKFDLLNDDETIGFWKTSRIFTNVLHDNSGNFPTMILDDPHVSQHLLYTLLLATLPPQATPLPSPLSDDNGKNQT
jgi:hypothetical protein